MKTLKELYEVENRWRSVLLWEFIRNKTFPQGSVFSGAFCHGCREIHKGSEKWIQQVFDIIPFVNKKRGEHAARAGGDPWQMSKNPAANGGDVNGKCHSVHGWLEAITREARICKALIARLCLTIRIKGKKV